MNSNVLICLNCLNLVVIAVKFIITTKKVLFVNHLGMPYFTLAHSETCFTVDRTMKHGLS